MSDRPIVIIIGKEEWKKYFLFFLIPLLLFGTRFLSSPKLLEQVIQSFLDYFTGWANLSGVFGQAPLLLIVLFTGYPLIILFGLIGGIWTLVDRRHPMYLMLLLFLIALIVTLAYPSAKQVDIVFIIPFFILFFVEFLIEFKHKLERHIKLSLFVAIVVVLITGIIGLAILNTVNSTLGTYETEQLLIAIIGCLLLVGIVFILVSWGWSYIYALNGLTIAMVLILGIFHLSTGLHVLGLSPKPEAEAWWLDGYFKDADLIFNSIERISIINSGLKNGIDVVIEDSSLPSVNWLLRGYDLIYFEIIPMYSYPSIIITKEENPPSLNEKYRGFKFILHADSHWIKNLDSYFLPIDFYRWLFLRKNSIQNEEYYLWARADLFPGNNIKFENIN